MKVHVVKSSHESIKSVFHEIPCLIQKIYFYLKGSREACNEFLKLFDVRFKIESLSDPNLFPRYRPHVDK